MIWLVFLLIMIGVVFQTLGAISLYRFPDVYTRMHGATKCTTFGSMFVCIGVIIYGILLALEGQAAFAVMSVHALLLMLFILLTNPAGAHAIARAAHRSGVKPMFAVVDKLAERGQKK